MRIENNNFSKKAEAFQLSKHYVLKKALQAREKSTLSPRKYVDESDHFYLEIQTHKKEIIKPGKEPALKKEAIIGILMFTIMAVTILFLSMIV